jgi:hypothetical protein
MNLQYKHPAQIIFLFMIQVAVYLPATGQDTLRFSGQVSSFININSTNTLPVWGGIRYIPQINYGFPPGKKGRFDSEFSVNLYGNAGFRPFDTLSASGKIKPYRAWIRYSSDQMEIRLGLQKLNFGSASMLRPLMWFDQMDPRDPLQLTDGVWGILGRYYFLNNANIWLWGLYGNNDPRGWEAVPVNKRYPEFGSRIQLPVPGGEAAISYHHRVADSRDMGSEITPLENIPENRIGFDAKWDLRAGFWIEGSYTNKTRNIGLLTNQLVLNAGADYTFPAGNGIYMAFEQLFASFDEQPFAFSNTMNFSLLSVAYPVGLFDRLSAIIYYNWNDRKAFSFINWQKQFDNLTIYLMAYLNPESYRLPAQTSTQNIFAGKGVQLMFVFNH